MNRLVLGVGSNSSDREWQIENAIKWIKEKFSSVKLSSIYETRAQNGKDDDYLNLVMRVDTNKSVEETTEMLKKYEAICGRTPASKLTGVIPIDIDIVVWNGEVLRPKELNYPYFSRGYHELIACGDIKVE